jgi:ABC-2 type transport system ATP-binding protein
VAVQLEEVLTVEPDLAELLAAGYWTGFSGDRHEPSLPAAGRPADRRETHLPIGTVSRVKAGPVELQGVVKHYGPTRALDGLDLSLRQGEIFGFLGPNGAGKTTAMRLALGLLKPDEGTVRLLGADPWQGVAARAELGYLPGGPRFYERMRGGQLLDHLAVLAGRPPVLRRHACRTLRLTDEELGRPVREYSRGMRQKLGVVQALQHDPALLMLDEPTEGLDPLVQEAFFALLRERRDAGRTVFLSSHVLSEVEALCERVGMIRAGRMVAVRSLAELKAERPRLVRITFEDAAAAAGFALDGATRVELDGARLTLAYAGDPNALVRELARERLVDLRIEDAALEQIFLAYYRDEDAAEVERT